MFNVLWLIVAGLFFYYWWSSWKYKGRAMGFAMDHCRRLDLQLLDQSMVIRGLWLARKSDGSLVIRRIYQFEFTSTGEQRYQGRIVLIGMALKSIDLEAYRLPDDG